MELTLRHQNFMLAVRQELGWPLFQPANDCLFFGSGREMDFDVGSHLAGISRQARKDIVYTGWASTRATEPTTFAIVYRGLMMVDVIDRVIPYAANDDAPLLLVSTRADEHFAVDDRGSLVRIAGKPKKLGQGRKLAMKRIKAAAATMGDELLPNNRFVPTGADWIDTEVPNETIVRFA